MKRKTLIITTAAAALGVLVALGATSYAHGPQGYGPQGYGQQGSGGYGMMHRGGGGFGSMGMGHGGMRHGGMGFGGMGFGAKGFGHGPCENASAVDRNLTVDQVTDIVKGHLAWRANDNVKLGTVVDAEDGTIKVTIVTKDDSPVRTIMFDKKTGRMSPAR